MTPGEKISPLNVTSTVINTGNCSLDLKLYGNDMTAGSYSIPVSQQRFATSSISYDNAYSLSTSPGVDLDFNLTKTTSSVEPAEGNIWWGIEVPKPQPKGNYTGINTFVGQKNELPW